MTYRPTPVTAPRLAGFPLRAVVWLAESSLGGALRRRLVRDAGAPLLERDFAEAPSLAPLLEPREHALGAETAPSRLASIADLEVLSKAELAPELAGLETILGFSEAYRRGE